MLVEWLRWGSLAEVGGIGGIMRLKVIGLSLARVMVGGTVAHINSTRLAQSQTGWMWTNNFHEHIPCRVSRGIILTSKLHNYNMVHE